MYDEKKVINVLFSYFFKGILDIFNINSDRIKIYYDDIKMWNFKI